MIKGLIGYLVILLTLLGSMFIGVSYLYAINETVTSGSAYGFSIGENKIDTYKYIVEHELGNSYGYIQTGNTSDPSNLTSIKQSSYFQLKQHDNWYVFIGNTTTSNNTLKIVFTNDKVTSLTRHRQTSSIMSYIKKTGELFEKLNKYYQDNIK